MSFKWFWIGFLNFNVTMMGQWYLIRSGINGELTPLYTTFSCLLTMARSRKEEELSVKCLGSSISW